MEIKPIKSEEDYQKAIARLEEIFDATMNTPEGDELEVLGILIDTYENEYFPKYLLGYTENDNTEKVKNRNFAPFVVR